MECWQFPISLYRRVSRLYLVLEAFRTKVVHFCFCFVCIKMPLLMCQETTIRKILVSVKFVSAILGPEMAAPILWTPGKMRSFCRKNHVRKIPLFLGGGFGGGGSADFIFMDARIFLKLQKTRQSRGQEISKDRSWLIRPYLTAQKRSKTSALGAFLPLT